MLSSSQTSQSHQWRFTSDMTWQELHMNTGEPLGNAELFCERVRQPRPSPERITDPLSVTPACRQDPTSSATRSDPKASEDLDADAPTIAEWLDELQEQQSASKTFALDLDKVGSDAAEPGPKRRRTTSGRAWSAAEDTLIVDLRRRGESWPAIAEKLPGKSHSACRNRLVRLAQRSTYANSGNPMIVTEFLNQFPHL